MAALLEFSSVLLLLLCISLSHQGGGAVATPAKCGLSSIVVKQVKTGAVVEGKPEYEVTMSNACRCAQSKVVVRCYGLSSVETVNSRAIRAVGDTDCLLRGGQPLAPGSPVKFKYAWMTPQDFPLVSSKISC